MDRYVVQQSSSSCWTTWRSGAEASISIVAVAARAGHPGDQNLWHGHKNNDEMPGDDHTALLLRRLNSAPV
jgi:hypothetical protein